MVQPQHLHIVPFIVINAITIMLLLLLLLLLLFLLSLFLDMMNDIGIDKKQQRYIIKKMINIAIRATYYIFCCRNRNRDSPGLMQFSFFFSFGFCFVFVFVFLFFLIIQSQAAFLNRLYVARFTIVHSKTQIKSPLFLL